MEYNFSDRVETLIERVYEAKKNLVLEEILEPKTPEPICSYCKKQKKNLQDGHCSKCITFHELSKVNAVRWLDWNDEKYNRKKKVGIDGEFTTCYVASRF